MATFTPKQISSAELDWPLEIAKLSLDSNIVFTKGSLLDFLRVIGVTVDVNNKIIAKMPRYAKFGTLQESDEAILKTPESTYKEEIQASDSNQAPTKSAQSSNQMFKQSAPPAQDDTFRPSCRVGSAPGGKDSMKGIFGN